MPPGSEQPIQNMPESAGVKTPEVAPVISETTPEVAPMPASPEKPSAETFADQAPAVVLVTPQTPVDPPVQAVAADPTEPVVEVDDTNPTENLDKKWVDAVETVIQKNEELPYEEEEAAEKLNIDYLWKRFKRKIGKDEN